MFFDQSFCQFFNEIYCTKRGEKAREKLLHREYHKTVALTTHLKITSIWTWLYTPTPRSPAPPFVVWETEGRGIDVDLVLRCTLFRAHIPRKHMKNSYCFGFLSPATGVCESTVPVYTPHIETSERCFVWQTLRFILFVICLLLFALPFFCDNELIWIFHQTKGSITRTHTYTHWRIYGINLGCGKFSPANRNDTKKKQYSSLFCVLSIGFYILASSTHHIHLGPFTASTIMPATLCLFHCMFSSHIIYIQSVRPMCV